jgi:hypothetical protein
MIVVDDFDRNPRWKALAGKARRRTWPTRPRLTLRQVTIQTQPPAMEDLMPISDSDLAAMGRFG